VLYGLFGTALVVDIIFVGNVKAMLDPLIKKAQRLRKNRLALQCHMAFSAR
jgi:hypothetical protein